MPPALALAGCSPTPLIDAMVPDRGYRILPDLAYDDGPRHRLDLYVPENPTGPLPLVVFFYGGGWRSGEKRFYRFVGEAFATRGFALAVPDYRLHPDIVYPGFLDDAAAAVAFLANRAGEHGLDARRLFLMGHSAGAYSGLAGPYDFFPFRGRFTGDVFGTAENPAATQPVNHVDGRAPPMLLASGLADDTVAPRNTTTLADRIRAKGGRVETRLYPGVGHIPLIGAFAAPLRFVAPVLVDTLRFLQEAGA